MGQIGTPATANGIIVDEFLIDNWPKEFDECWIGIYDEKKTAYLINNNEENSGTVKEIFSEPEEFKSKIVWDKDYRYEHLFVNPKYRDSGVAWAMAMWLRTWMAVNKNIKILPPEEHNATIIMKMFINRWEQTYKNSGY